MSRTKIEWATDTWNPIVGCTKVSPGCVNCYAERMAKRFPWGRDWAEGPVLIPERLSEPLQWRKPRRAFVCSTSDLFHEAALRADHGQAVGKVFGVMAQAHQHTFLVLTKRAAAMLEWSRSVCHYPKGDRTKRPIPGWPPNVWAGVSCEDQKRANERIPLLLQTPAAKRFVSVEPLLEPVDLIRPMAWWLGPPTQAHGMHQGLDQVIVGGESGPGARGCNVSWVRSIVGQCSMTTPCFVKQIGSNPWLYDAPLKLKDSKGGDPAEWPADLRVREWPE